MIDIEYCMSSYLAFRYVVKPDVGWKHGFTPEFPNPKEHLRIEVKTPEEILESLTKVVAEETKGTVSGILLSGGIDSAMIFSALV